jgi:CMP-N-acetylneuraminic acid synthetase
MRPSELALDDTPHLPVVRHALEFCESQENRVYDQVFIFQPTSPLREVSDVDGAIKLLEDTGADSVVGLVSIEDHHPLRVKRIENGKIVPFYDSEPVGARRQDLRPKAYVRSGSVYAINRGAVMGKGSLLGEDSRPWIMSQDKGVNVDTEEDLIILQHYIPKLFPGLIY